LIPEGKFSQAALLLLHFALAGVVWSIGRENTGSLGRHVCFRKDRIVGDSALVEFPTMEPAICPTP
jgi:hypothetical protein